MTDISAAPAVTETLAVAADDGITIVPARRRTLLLGVFVVDAFLGAFLLFMVQPMATRLLLPSLGGSPAVWNSAMVFFQLALLAGYAWAGLTAHRRAGVRLGAQFALLLLPLLVLPIGVPGGWRPPADVRPELWTIGLLALMVGLPFLALSTTSPTLQRWFAATDHPRAADPYFLYAAGNAGSLLGLLAYPVVVERVLGVADQTRWWAGGYVLFLVLTAAAAALQHRYRVADTAAVGTTAAGTTAAAAAEVLPDADGSELAIGTGAAAGGGTGAADVAAGNGRPTWATRLRWAAVAAVPSGLLLGVTRHVSTDVAAVALLWVIPLSLYLATFIVAFGRRSADRLVRASGWAYALLVVPTAVTLTGSVRLLEQLVVLHLVTFTAGALLCHGRLAETRPSASHLTTFYVWLAVGGALGGLLTAIVAPVVFDRIWEYPLFLAAATFVGLRRASWRWLPLYALGAGLATLVAVRVFQGWTPTSVGVTLGGLVALVGLGCARFLRPALAVALAALTLLAGGVGGMALRERSWPGGVRTFTFGPNNEANVSVDRTFFGVYRVIEANDGTNRKHRLISGTTTHGEQWMDTPEARRIARSYYHRATPIGQWFVAHTDDPARSVALVGLGTGTLAAYARPGDAFDFYEIDPEVVRIAEDPERFTYLSDAAVRPDIILGDGRLRLEAEDRRYDLIVLDAFGSDAIPTHLLTREATQLYLDRLQPGGVIAFHISSRVFELAPPLARIAEDLGLAGIHQRHTPTVAEAADGAFSTEWVFLARSDDDLVDLRGEGWEPLENQRRGPAWTDDFVDVLGAFRWRLDG